jgi:hypothetical protein
MSSAEIGDLKFDCLANATAPYLNTYCVSSMKDINIWWVLDLAGFPLNIHCTLEQGPLICDSSEYYPDVATTRSRPCRLAS